MANPGTCHRSRYRLSLSKRLILAWFLTAMAFAPCRLRAEAIPIDLDAYRRDCGVTVKVNDRDKTGLIQVEWPVASRERGILELDTRPGKPLLAGVRLEGANEGGLGWGAILLKGVDPVAFVTVGERNAPPGRPPGMSNFNVFFDNPAKRPHQTYRASLRPNRRQRRPPSMASMLAYHGKVTVQSCSGPSFHAIPHRS